MALKLTYNESHRSLQNDSKETTLVSESAKEYETLVQYLEAESRKYAKIESQLKICVENLKFKIEEITNQFNKEKVPSSAVDEAEATLQ